jgi:hypothetical protein
MDQDVVCIPFKDDCGKFPLHPFVKSVVQKQVGQQRTYYTPLGGSAAAAFFPAVRMTCRGFQPSLHIQLTPARRAVMLQGLEYQLMRQIVKESFDVQVYDPVFLPALLPGLLQCIMRASPGSVSI